MAFNGSGVYILPVTTVSPAIGNTTIDSSAQNTLTADIASALTTCITKDGQTAVTANLPMSTFRHTGVGNASALQTYASADDVIDNTLLYAGASAAGTDTYAASLPISPGAYKTGQMYSFLADVANTGACTINFNLIGALNIKLLNGNDPETGDIQIGPVFGFYDGTNFVLLNSAFAGLSASQFLRSDADTVATGNITITNGAPQVIQVETGVTADNSTWRAYPNGESYIFDVADDALSTSAQWLQIDRTGTTVDQAILSCNIINLAAPSAVQINGVDIESNATQLSYNNVTLGTVAASKTVTADVSGNVDFPSGTELQIEGTAVTARHVMLDTPTVLVSSSATTNDTWTAYSLSGIPAGAKVAILYIETDNDTTGVGSGSHFTSTLHVRNAASTVTDRPIGKVAAGGITSATRSLGAGVECMIDLDTNRHFSYKHVTLYDGSTGTARNITIQLNGYIL